MFGRFFRLELIPKFGFDIFAENSNMRVPVIAHMFMVEAQRVSELVHHNAETITTCNCEIRERFRQFINLLLVSNSYM